MGEHVLVGKFTTALQVYDVLHSPEAMIAAITDRWTAELLQCIVRREKDCLLCGDTLTLVINEDGTLAKANPAILAYLPVDKTAIVFGVCCSCVWRHGSREALRQATQYFLDKACDGGSVWFEERWGTA